jgi:hypothetical protein
MDNYTLSDDLFGRHTVDGADPVPEDGWPYEEFDSVRPKFDSVAAAILHVWSLDSFQDESCGDAQYGNGWHALFRSERAVLHNDNFGFVSAWRIEDGRSVDEYWSEIEKGAVYPDDDEPEDDVVHVEMACCGTRYATVAETLGHACPENNGEG